MPKLWKYRAELFFILFCGWQFHLMTGYALHQVLPGAPMANDQVDYLFQTYRAAVIGQDSGAWAGLRQVLREAPAAGFGLQLLAYGLMLVTGIGRMGALAVNIGYFALVPGLLFLIIGRDKPFSFYLFLCGLWLSIQSMYGLVGSPLDFRLDFAGMALFTVVVALLWRTRAFSDHRVCGLTGLAVVWLGMTRSIMIPHLTVMALIVLAGLLVVPGMRRGRSPWLGIALTVAVIVVGLVPYLVLQWDRIWGYYVVGHVIGPEKDLRAQMAGIHSLIDQLSYYPRELFQSQLGATAQRLVKWTLVAALVLTIADRVRTRWSLRPTLDLPPPVLRGGFSAWGLLVATAALLGPYLTLTANVQKSWVVANVFIVGVIGLALLAFLAILVVLPRLFGTRPAQALGLLLGLLVFGTGVSYQRHTLGQPSVITQHRADYAARDQVVALIGQISAARHWLAPSLFVDHVGDLDGLQMEFSHFERYGWDLPVQRMMTDLFEIPPATLWKTLPQAEFLIIRDRRAGITGNFPYDFQMARLNAELHAFCRTRCDRLLDFTYFNTPLVLFARKAEGSVQ